MERTTLSLLAFIAVVMTKPHPGHVELVAGPDPVLGDQRSNLELVDDHVDVGAPPSFSMVWQYLT